MKNSKSSIYVMCQVRRTAAEAEPLFAFHAANMEEAESLAIGYARYHGHQPSEYTVWKESRYREIPVGMHDDYVDHESSRLLNFYYFNSSADSHPLRVESHLVSSRLTPAAVTELLKEVARSNFGTDSFITLSRVQHLPANPLFGLAAMSDDERYVVPSRS